MFKLSHFGGRLLNWLSSNPAGMAVYLTIFGDAGICMLSLAVYPSVYASEMKQFISNGLSDLSVSRQSSRLQWGIPVPGDPSHVVSTTNRDRQT